MKKQGSSFFEIVHIQSRVNQIFDSLLEVRDLYTSPDEIAPCVDVYVTEKAFHAVFEVSGMKVSDMKLKIAKGHVVLEGEKITLSTGLRQFVCMERKYGHFQRAVHIPCAVDGSSAEALMDNGLLHVTLPRISERRGKIIQIKIEKK